LHLRGRRVELWSPTKTISTFTNLPRRGTGASKNEAVAGPLHLGDSGAEQSDKFKACFDPAARTDTLLGFKVVRWLLPPSSDPDEASSEEWLAPSLGCYPLLRIYRETDGEVGYNEALNVRLGEPDHQLFVIPGDWTEVSPVELELRERQLGLPPRGDSIRINAKQREYCLKMAASGQPVKPNQGCTEQ